MNELEYPMELGKCMPFFPLKERESIPFKEPIKFTTPWGSYAIRGYKLIPHDELVLMALLNMPAQIKDGKMHVECTKYQIAKAIYPHREFGDKDYERITASLIALGTASIEITTKQWGMIGHIAEVAWENEETRSGKVFVKINEKIVELLLLGRTKLIELAIWHKMSDLGKLLYTFVESHKNGITIRAVNLWKTLNAENWDLRNFIWAIKKQAEILIKCDVISSFEFSGRGQNTIFKFRKKR